MLFILFGASGHLSKTKILPALREVCLEINDLIEIVGYGRSRISNEEIKNRIFGDRNGVDDRKKAQISKLSDVTYVDGEYNDEEKIINIIIQSKEYKNNKRVVFYFGTTPQIFGTIIESIKGVLHNISEKLDITIAVEKPFGSCLKSAKELDAQLSSFKKPEVYIIDHYIAKKGVSHLRDIANLSEFKSHLNGAEHIWIRMKELNELSQRPYFWDYGSVKDVMQNHLMQILLNLVGREKKSFLNSLKIQKAVLGSFKENSVDTYGLAIFKMENTETLVVLECGKGLDNAIVDVTIRKDHSDFYTVIQSNNLEVPKKQNKPIGRWDAYENILYDIIEKEENYKVDYESIEHSWILIDEILKEEIFLYEKGDKRPKEASQVLLEYGLI